MNLALICRRWADIAKDPYAETEWLMHTWKTVAKICLREMLIHFGRCDQKLIELKIEHNIGQLDADRIRTFQNNKSSMG
ncbi:15327_t:CDS:2 [Funneliformis mosseae]|uniref:15327_t:CDS:1 n=1 Tax=Funneliformis mosseae TaxID=27381 RepID=A0A9N9BKR9_FUNMO|nr:15327_t:CDS:2 [Funneliformis mosseae]